MTTEHVTVPRDGSRPGSPSWIRSTTFATGESQHGYDADVMVRLREAMATAVESWQPVGPVIRAAGLVPGPTPNGCDAQAVNEWLGSVIALMREEPLAPPGAPTPRQPVAAAPSVETDASLEIAALAATTRPTASSPATSGDPQVIAQRINDARFTPLRFRHGYVMGEVDDFLDELVAAVTAGEPIAARVQEVRFSESRMREAYLMEDVEAFLAELVRDVEGVRIARPQPTA